MTIGASYRMWTAGQGRRSLWLAALVVVAGSCSGRTQVGGAAPGGNGGDQGPGGRSGYGQAGSGATTELGGRGGAGGAEASEGGGRGGPAQGGTSGSGPAGHSGAGGGAGGAGGQVVRACAGSAASQPAPGACRSASECGPPAPVMCCTTSNCWPESFSCPLPPVNCPPFQCTTSDECQPGGTCVSSIGGCPRCESRTCHYPPPPCTQVPDSCGAEARCQADGTCKPVSCTEGHACVAPHYRCNPTGGRADANGCELVPCDAGWTCEENTRCTNPTDKASHGCTALACHIDGDCDCGYCVEGHCSAGLGHCSYPPS